MFVYCSKVMENSAASMRTVRVLRGVRVRAAERAVARAPLHSHRTAATFDPHARDTCRYGLLTGCRAEISSLQGGASLSHEPARCEEVARMIIRTRAKMAAKEVA